MYIENINGPADVKKLNIAQMTVLASEMRDALLIKLSRHGGHFGPNFGMVEATIALHYVFESPKDKFVFDVSHQSYPHKMLTGRKDAFLYEEHYDDVSGYSSPHESEHDHFTIGHTSTSVSLACGLAKGRDLKGEDGNVVAIIGDGSLSGGEALEALDYAAELDGNLIILVNDNDMSIAENHGGLYQNLRLLRETGGKAECNLFRAMGLDYRFVADGNDIASLIEAFKAVKDSTQPVVVHIVTQKGKGYAPAEENPDVFHGIGHFDPEKGMEPRCGHLPTFSDTFSETIDALGAQEPRICAITAAMLRGTGLDAFAAHYPERCFDVGIAEGHAVSMAGGLAKQGMIPVVAIYSTFLQRAYDMLLQDVAMLGLHVVFAVDRAGLVGGDGETHHGVFDVNYLRSVPGMQVLCPASQAELGQMLRRAVLEMTGPVAVRYPRGCDGTFTGIAEQPCLREGSDITLVTYGTLVNEVLAAAKMLQARGISAEVLKLPSIKPLDVRTVAASMRKTGRLLVAEESVCIGCVGKELLASLRARGVGGPVRLCNLGDRFIPHGAVPELYRMAGLDAKSLADAAWEVCQNEA